MREEGYLQLLKLGINKKKHCFITRVITPFDHFQGVINSKY